MVPVSVAELVIVNCPGVDMSIHQTPICVPDVMVHLCPIILEGVESGSTITTDVCQPQAFQVAVFLSATEPVCPLTVTLVTFRLLNVALPL